MTQAAPVSQTPLAAEAMRLMAGRRDDVLRAFSLIERAAADGDANALERKALLEAVGCERPRDWGGALDTMQDAAERGSSAAQAQLVVLSQTTPGESHDWRALRSCISIEALARVPDKRVICERPRLRVIRQFASTPECDWLIQRARSRMRPAAVVTPGGTQSVQAARTNSAIEFQLADMDLVIEAVRTRISAATRLPLPLFEPSQVLHYSPGQEFRPHHDYFDPDLPGHAEQLRNGQRIATFLIYLNEDFTGGETAFPDAGISFRGKTGDALFLANVERNGRPDPESLHAGMPPLSGEKWLFSQWICDRPPPARSAQV